MAWYIHSSSGCPISLAVCEAIPNIKCMNVEDDDEKEERSKQGQTNNKAKQHSTPKAVTFPKKNELPQVGLEPTTFYTLHVLLS